MFAVILSNSCETISSQFDLVKKSRDDISPGLYPLARFELRKAKGMKEAPRSLEAETYDGLKA